MANRSSTWFIRYWRSRLTVLTAVLDGLEGAKFQWGTVGRSTYIPMLRKYGITLVTRTWLEQRGYVLNRGAKPVGSIYFSSPISGYRDVYVLECQAWLKHPDKLAKFAKKKLAALANERTEE